jgi:phosphate transport system substrate-binding protein
MFANFRQNEDAVSPIVATLVLIVVAVVGAVAVGTIMGTFSNDVADQTNVGDVAGSSAYELLIGGSTTVQPVSELLAKSFMAENPGVKINVQGGGSGVGITSAKMGLVDIGAASKPVDDSELTVTQIGGSAVVVIAHKDFAADNVTKTELYNFITAGTKAGNVSTADKFVQRAEDSGTEETFAQWVTDKAKKSLDEYNTENANGNAGVLESVKSHTNYIGFVDAGYALNDDDVKVLNIVGYDSTADSKILQALKDDKAGTTSTAYPNGLTRPLNYMTKTDAPNSIAQKFIDFAQSPAAIDLFHEAGMYSILEFS